MPPKKGAAKSARETKKKKEEETSATSAKAKDAPTESTKSNDAPAVQSKKRKQDSSTPVDAPDQSNDAPTKTAKSNNAPTTNNKKRKQDSSTASTDTASTKAPRRSARSAPRPNTAQLLTYLLSTSAEELVRPADENEAIQADSELRTYSNSVLTPFEELLSAVVLSRPISHRLGLRSIRTLFNPPYSLRGAKAVQDAGAEKVHQALWDARTQHKGKTAEQVLALGEVVLEEFTAAGDAKGEQLGKVLNGDEDVESVRETLKESIKGLGDTGLDIFVRRVQWLWEHAYPFVDKRTALALKKVGLPSEAKVLKEEIEKAWSELETGHLAGENEAARQRRAFVVVLERAIAADLEGKPEELFAAAAEEKSA